MHCFPRSLWLNLSLKLSICQWTYIFVYLPTFAFLTDSRSVCLFIIYLYTHFNHDFILKYMWMVFACVCMCARLCMCTHNHARPWERFREKVHLTIEKYSRNSNISFSQSINWQSLQIFLAGESGIALADKRRRYWLRRYIRSFIFRRQYKKEKKKRMIMVNNEMNNYYLISTAFKLLSYYCPLVFPLHTMETIWEQTVDWQ